MNLDKIKAKLSSLDRKGGGSKRPIWKPAEGDQTIRLVPYKHDPDWPFRELLFYYDLTNRTIISPDSFGQPDPIVEKAQELKRTGEKEDWMMGNKISPKLRTYVPVIVRGEESEGVKFWGFGKKVYEGLLRTLDDPDYGDITDLENGRDVVITYTKGTDGGFANTDFRVKPNQTPVSTDKSVIDSIKAMPKIEEIWEPPTYAELETLFENYINNIEGDDEAPPAANAALNDLDGIIGEKVTKAKVVPEDPELDAILDQTPGKSTADPLKTAVVTDIDSAFDDMFN